MGNRDSRNILAANNQIKSQVVGESTIYDLIDLHGGGELVEKFKAVRNNRDPAVQNSFNNYLRKALKPFLYNNGEGKLIPISQLVEERERSRNGANRRKIIGRSTLLRSKSRSQNQLLHDQHDIHPGELVHDEDGNICRLLCWDLTKRGTVGENAIHICLLLNESLLTELAQRMIELYPNLSADIYVGDEYYGEAPLHMAIVNQDLYLVKFLLDHGAPVDQIACGKFFFPLDQKEKRISHIDCEYVTVGKDESDYEGFAYFGEYPLAFAACLDQLEICKILIRHGANINAKDANGNSFAHLTVIRSLPGMFDFGLENGADIYAKNNLGYNCLTLAAKMGNKEMVKHILELERKPYWTYGDVSCAAYPLSNLDTISYDWESKGAIDRNSVLSIVVSSEDPRHLDMLDGLVEEILDQKWALFARKRFYIHLVLYAIYLLIFNAAFILRPPFQPIPGTSHCQLKNSSLQNYFLCPRSLPGTPRAAMDGHDIARLTLELLTVAGSLGYLISLINDFTRQGFHIVFQSLLSAPTKLLFLLSCSLVFISIPGLFICALTRYVNVVWFLAIIFAWPYCLFFCRGFRLVGPFVVMIGKMIKGDLIKFIILYLIFLVAFSQAMVVAFAGRGGHKAFLNRPLGAIEGMFILSLGEFDEIQGEFDKSPYPVFVKTLFIIYVVLANVLLVNMLIAMMGKTYETILETRKEWKRQWAQTVLVLETSISPQRRLRYQERYSEDLDDGSDGRAIVMRWHHDEQEKKRDHRRKIKKLNELADLLYRKELEKKKNSSKFSNYMRDALQKGITKKAGFVQARPGSPSDTRSQRNKNEMIAIRNTAVILQTTRSAKETQPELLQSEDKIIEIDATQPLLFPQDSAKTMEVIDEVPLQSNDEIKNEVSRDSHDHQITTAISVEKIHSKSLRHDDITDGEFLQQSVRPPVEPVKVNNENGSVSANDTEADNRETFPQLPIEQIPATNRTEEIPLESFQHSDRFELEASQMSLSERENNNSYCESRSQHSKTGDNTSVHQFSASTGDATNIVEENRSESSQYKRASDGDVPQQLAETRLDAADNINDTHSAHPQHFTTTDIDGSKSTLTPLERADMFV